MRIRDEVDVCAGNFVLLPRRLGASDEHEVRRQSPSNEHVESEVAAVERVLGHEHHMKMRRRKALLRHPRSVREDDVKPALAERGAERREPVHIAIDEEDPARSRSRGGSPEPHAARLRELLRNDVRQQRIGRMDDATSVFLRASRTASKVPCSATTTTASALLSQSSKRRDLDGVQDRLCPVGDGAQRMEHAALFCGTR